MSGKNQKNRGTILMRMFYPDRREKSAYTIDYADLYRKGYRGVIFDIDNTLVPHGAGNEGGGCVLCVSSGDWFFHLSAFQQSETACGSVCRCGRFYLYRKCAQAFGEKLPGGMPENGDQRGAGGLCRGSAFHRCVRCKTDRTLQYSDRADQSERGNSDRSETVSGAHCTVLL